MDRKKRRRGGGDIDRDHYVHAEPGPIEGMKLYVDKQPAYFDPLEEPTWLPVPDAVRMRDNDFVLGFWVDDKPYAIPWWVLKNHHAANLTIEGHHLLITLCENCSSGAAFDPVVRGQRLHFAVGGLYRGTFVLKDAETQTLWTPFLGGALHGPLAGEDLEPLALAISGWAEWKSLHPDTFVEAGLGESRGGHGAGTEPGSLLDNEQFMVGRAYTDTRLLANVLVLGVTVGTASRAYPLVEIHDRGGVVNDDLGGKPIVLFSTPESVLAMAFSRHFAGRALTFEPLPDGRIIDAETGSTWDVEGRCLAGELAGSRLEFQRFVLAEWYEFSASHPAVEIFGTRRKEDIQPRQIAEREDPLAAFKASG